MIKRFKLDNKYRDNIALYYAHMSLRNYDKSNPEDNRDKAVKEILEEYFPGYYATLSRGDKCRIGRDISILYNHGCYPHLERGKKKGCTNRYHLVV